MSYTLGIPSDGQSLGNSKPQVRTNFTEIFNAFAVNHVPLNGSGQGKHLFVQMPENGDKITGANEVGLYCNEAQSYANLFFRQESGGSDPITNQGAIIQMTNVAPTNAQKGSSFLPGGLLIQWNQVTLGASGTATTTSMIRRFTLAGVDVQPYSLTLTPIPSAVASLSGLSLGVNNFDPANARFDILRFGGVGGSLDVFYIAIGPRT